MIATNGKKACVIMDGDKVVTKILVLQPVYELEGDLLLKFAVDVKKGTTLFQVDGTNITANDDYKAGDYLYFAKGTFKPTVIRFAFNNNDVHNYYSEVRFLKGLDMSNTTHLEFMLGYWGAYINGASKAKVIDVSNFDTSKVTNMGYMFAGCSSVTTLDVSGWDTSKVTDIGVMFAGCASLTSLDVSNFDTSKVTNMGHMFAGCSSLTTLDVSFFDTSKVTNMSSMFAGCSSLTNLIFGSKWGTQTSTATNALTLDLSYLGSSKSYKLTDATYTSMLTMYDRASAGLATMTIQFSTKHNLPDGFAEKMSALGYTIQLV